MLAVPQGPKVTKPVVTPVEKMKALHWNRVVLGEVKGDNIWAGSEPIKIDPVELARLYGANSGKAAAKEKAGAAAAGGGGSRPGAAVEAKKKEKTRILSDKRFNALSIALSHLPPLPNIIQGIRRMDVKVITEEQVIALHRSMPTEDELQSVATHPAADEELSKPDLFVRGLSQIPVVNARVDCWRFSIKFPELLADATQPLQMIASAVKSVRSSKTLRRALLVVLEVGNYMNGGTARGQADAFDLALLKRLTFVKDGEGKNTLLHTVLEICERNFGAGFVDSLLSEVLPCKEAKELDMRSAVSDANQFIAEVREHKQLSSLVIAGSRADSSLDPFPELINTFNGKAEIKAADLKSRVAELQESYNQLANYLYPSPAMSKPASKDLFETVWEFAETVQTLKAALAKPAK